MTPRLTPIDILHLSFRRKISGYAVQEVEDFRRQAAEELEVVLTNCAELRDRLHANERELQHYKGLESAMHEALVMAQKSADEIRKSAKTTADAHIQDAGHRMADMQQKVDLMRTERRRIICDLRATLNAQMVWLDRELDVEMANVDTDTAYPLLRVA